MAVSRETRSLGMPWEAQFGYVQAVRVGDTIYMSGQLGHDDDGNLVGEPAGEGESGALDAMTAQMRQTYVNAAKVLASLGASLDDVVEEVIYVTDMDSAFAAAGPVRKIAYGSDRAPVASTILTTSRLALPGQLVEIRFTARV